MKFCCKSSIRKTPCPQAASCLHNDAPKDEDTHVFRDDPRHLSVKTPATVCDYYQAKR